VRQACTGREENRRKEDDTIHLPKCRRTWGVIIRSGESFKYKTARANPRMAADTREAEDLQGLFLKLGNRETTKGGRIRPSLSSSEGTVHFGPFRVPDGGSSGGDCGTKDQGTREGFFAKGWWKVPLAASSKNETKRSACGKEAFLASGGSP